MLVNPWGDVVASAGGDEGVMLGEIDFDYLKKKGRIPCFK